MTKIVEVDESQDVEKPRSNKKHANDIIADNHNQLQSVESLAQMTDTEDAQQSKRQTS